MTPFGSLLLAQVGDALSLSDSEASAQGFPKGLELHARMLVGARGRAVTGLFWPSNPGAPASQVRDALNELPVYSSRVIALGSLQEQLHSAVQQLLRRVLAHVLNVGPMYIPLHYDQDNSFLQFHAAGIAWDDPGIVATVAHAEPEKTELIDKNRVIQVDLCFDVLFDRYMSDHLNPWIAVAQRIHLLIANQAELARLAFLQLRELIAKSLQHRPPTQLNAHLQLSIQRKRLRPFSPAPRPRPMPSPSLIPMPSPSS